MPPLPVMTIQLLDLVILLKDIPDLYLKQGTVGTVVEVLKGGYEVEFSDEERTIISLGLRADQIERVKGEDK